METEINTATSLTYKMTSAGNHTFCIQTTSVPDRLDSRGIWSLRLTIVTMVSMLVVLSNVVNIIVLSKNCHIPKISRLFLLNLSCSDLSVGIISCVPTIVPAITGSWPYGDTWCQIAGIVHGTSVTISIWSLSMISIDRYLAICKPMAYVSFRSLRKAYFVIAGMWTLAILTFFSPLLTKPNFVYYQYSQEENICGLYWEYEWFCNITAVCIPLLSGAILIFTNVKILHTILRRRKKLANVSSTTTIRRRGANAMKMLVITTSFYFLAWGPYVTQEVLVRYVGGVRVPAMARFLTLWLANSNSFVNVLIFAFVFRVFRYEVRLLLVKLICCIGLQNLATDFNMRTSNSQPLSNNKGGLELKRTTNGALGVKIDIVVAVAVETNSDTLTNNIRTTILHKSEIRASRIAERLID